jgi:hypothetical protein
MRARERRSRYGLRQNGLSLVMRLNSAAVAA